MKTLRSDARVLVSVLLCWSANSLAAQATNWPHQGAASGLAAAISLESTPTISEGIRIKAPLDQSAPPMNWTRTQFSSGPDYSLPAMFGSALAPWVEIDAESSGNDLFPAPLAGSPPSGELDFSAGRWLSLTISIKNSSPVVSQSVFDAIKMADINDPLGADLVSYYFHASSGLDPSLIGATLPAQLRQQIRLTNGEEIDALDFGIGVLLHSGYQTGSRFFPHTTNYYFSLDPSCIAAINSLLKNKFANGKPADASTVYRLGWSTLSGWSLPTEFCTSSTLNLGETDNLDALCVNESALTTAGSTRIIFSTQLKTGVSQLRVYDSQTTPGGPVDLMTRLDATTLVPATEALGTKGTSNDDTTDIDALCGIEPESGFYDFLYGTPTSVPLFFGQGFLNPLGISVSSSGDTSIGVTSQLNVQVTGLTSVSPGSGVVTLLIRHDTNTNSSVWLPVTTVARMAGEDSVEFTILNPALPGLTFSLAAAYIDNGGALSESWVSQMQIF